MGQPPDEVESTVKAVLRIRGLLTPAQIHDLLALPDLWRASPSLEQVSALEMPPTKIARLRGTLAGSRREGRLREVLVGLAVAAATPDTPRIEIVWTGPKVGVPVRLTLPVVEELVVNSRSRITIVGYEVTSGADTVLRLLSRKAREGVDITLIVDKAKEKPDLMRWARHQEGFLEIYSRPPDPEDPMSSLHIKCILVDGAAGLFGSANLSYHGLLGNVELGVLVRDENLVARADVLMEELKRLLMRVYPDSPEG